MCHRLGIVLLACGLGACVAAFPCAAATFYVDQSSGACSDAGPGTEAQPYCTISAALAAHSGPGVTVIVKPGIYREQVTVPASGSAASPFVIRGQGGTVTVDGADDLSDAANWALHAGSVYVAVAVTHEPLQVFVDGARLTPSTAEPPDLPAKTFRYIAPYGLYVNLGGDPPGLHTVHVGQRMHGFRLANRAHVTVKGFDVLHADGRGFYLTGASTASTIQDNRVRFAHHYGIALSGCQGIRVAGNIATDNQDDGISLVAGATGCIIEDNECARNAHPVDRRAQGIELSGASGNLIQRNRVHHNQDSGEHLSAGASNNTSLQNRSWSNGDHGFDRLNATNTLSIGNVAYGNVRDGFSNEGASSGGQMYDCIAINNGLTTNRFNLWVDPQASIGFVSDHNIFWNSTSAPPVKYIATIYPTLAQYVAASGQDVHSLAADPRFVDAPGADFHLLPGSPAIDAAATGMSGWPAMDAEGRPRWDDPGVVDTGTGPVSYADRGALEYRSGADAPPVVTAPPAVTATLGSPLAVVVTAADPDGDPIVSLTASGMPPAARFIVSSDRTAGTMWWTPGPELSGPYIVTFTAANALTGSAVTQIAVQAPNQPPVAALRVTPSSGEAPLNVSADASGSGDPDGTVVSYRFDFGDGTVVGPQPGPVAFHRYGAGVWAATVTVTDGRGGTASASRVVLASPDPSPNLVGNPSFETDLAGWGMVLGSTLERVPGGADGDYTLQVTGLPTTTSFGVNDTPNWVVNTAAAGIRYRLSAQVRSAGHGGTVKIRVREYLAGVLQGGSYSTGIVLTPAWQEVVMDHVTTAPGSTLDLQVMNFPVAPGEVMLVDDVVIRDVTFVESVTGVGEDQVPLRVRIVPSPVRTEATFSVVTSVRGGLEVHLFDLAGRRVRRLLERPDAPPGLQRFVLDGRDDDGVPLRSGMYFYRVRAAEGEVGGRFLIVR